jgi:hypothetical protein
MFDNNTGAGFQLFLQGKEIIIDLPFELKPVLIRFGIDQTLFIYSEQIKGKGANFITDYEKSGTARTNCRI